MGRIDWKNAAACLFCILVLVLALFFVGRVLLAVLLPFGIGLLLATGARVPARRLSQRLHMSVRVLSVLFLLLYLLLLAATVAWLVHRLVFELRGLVERLPSMEASLGERPGEMLLSLFGIRSAIAAEGVGARLFSSAVEGLLSALSEQLPSFLSRVASALPSALLFLVLALLSGFYFCVDRACAPERMLRFLPTRMQTRLTHWGRRLRHVTLRYLRAYLLLFLLTAAALFVGFLFLRVEYALLLSLLIAVVDLLPVLGTGSILLPWALVALLQGRRALALGLVILYLAVLLLRQVAEPRILGGSLGLHPLLTLLASYACLYLFGVTGLLLAPFLALLCKSLLLQFFPTLKADAGDT